MQTFCTIITADYFPKAAVLYRSLQKFDDSVNLVVLVTDNKPVHFPPEKWKGITLLATEDLSCIPVVKGLTEKYAYTNGDFFRWSLKPVLLLFLLNNGFKKVIYADCDLFFVGGYQFLFDGLEKSNILLTPHWNNKNPTKNEEEFLLTFRHGIYNAGFVAAATKALPALQWWAQACNYKMGKHFELGIFDDQKYLDALPALFEDVQIIHHRGCNVATWNYDECKRTMVGGQVLINEKYPLVFLHFTHDMMKMILTEHDALLRPYFDAYEKLYEEDGFALASFFKEVKSYTNASVLKKIKWRLKVRTRLKALFYKLSQ